MTLRSVSLVGLVELIGLLALKFIFWLIEKFGFDACSPLRFYLTIMRSIMLMYFVRGFGKACLSSSKSCRFRAFRA